MERQILRLALLLAVFAFVGYAGLNGTADITRIRTAHAAVNFVLISGGVPGNLDFSIGPAPGCPDTLLPGESCTANVTVDNNGTETIELLQPTSEASGVLHTCTGEDRDNPGSGGANLLVVIDNLSFTPDVTDIEPGETASFDVTVTLDPNVGNACQGKQGEVLVSLIAFFEEAVAEEETPPNDRGPDVPPPSFPQPGPVAGFTPPFFQPPIPGSPAQPAPPVAEVGGVRQVAPTPVATFIAEVSPTRLPPSGQGGFEISEQVAGVAEALFVGTGLLAGGLFLVSIGIILQRKREGR